MAKNLLVDWMNANNTKRANRLASIQTDMANKTSATNPNTVTTPNTPTIARPAISRPATINLQKAQQPVQTRLDNLNNQTLPVTQPGTITGNNPAFVNGKLRPSSTNEVMNAAQSRFIGFQQQQPTYPNTTIGTGQEGKSFEKLYNGGYMRIESNAEKAEKYNKKEEEKFRTTSEALMDFQRDVLKNNGKMTDWQLENRYPEFSDNLDSLKELQNELRPIVQSGMGVDPEQLAEYYPELLKPKKTYSIEAIKKNAAETEKAYENAKKIMDKALTLNVEGLSSNGLKVARDYDTLFNIVDVVKKKHSLGDANNSEILGYLLKNNDKVRELWDEIEASKANLTKTDKAILNRKDASLLDRVITEGTTGIIDLAGKGLEKLGLEGNRKATDEEIETAIRAKEKLESDFANQTWKKLAVEINVPLDSLEKFAYRTYKDVQNKILEKGSEYTKEKITKTIKSAFKKELGVDLTDEQVESIRNLYDTAVTPSINQEIQTNQQNVMDYLESVNKEYQSKRGTLDEDIENYTNNRSMTKMLLNRDLRGFGYKSSGEAAQNAEMPLMILAGTVAPEIVLPLMTMDSYARESQESFEELMEVQQKNGISVQDAYENAQEGAAIVGIASAAVEVGLEKILGGVETTASKAFHDLLIKDVAEKTTKMVAERGLAEMLKQGLVTQFRSSFEEGMEEILQQAIHNKALQKYDPDQKLTEGLLQSFEGGFFNWMNLLGGGGDILSNIQQNKTNIVQNANQTAYNLGERARNVVDNLNQGAYNAGANTRNILDNVRNRVTTQNTQENQTNTLNNVMDTVTKQTNTEENQTNTSITPVNNNIQATNEVIEAKDDNTTTEKKNTAIKEGGLGEKVLESLNGLDENTRERIKKNPYSVEESKNLIKEMDENPGIDFGDYQNGRYEDVLNTILNKLEQKEDKRRNDIGSLYDKLEESNIDVDVTELKNKVAEFEAQAEALGDIITPAEQGQIKTILKNIQEIGDGTMDVWKVRRIADKRTKGSASSSYDGIGLIREIRDTIDSVIREQNPDMKEVDKAYRKVLNEISEIKGKLFYKKGGQVKSNAVSTVKNMLNAGNRLDLNNLEKYLPGIKDQLEAIRDSKFVYNAYTTGRGSRFISGIARGVFGNIGKAIGFFAGGWGGLLGGAVIDAGIDKAMVNLTRKALRDTITKETEASKAELERISKKIEEGKKLDAEDKARLKELGEKIMKNGEQMAKTKAEKEAWNKYMEEINDNITPQTTEEEQEKNKVTKKRATKKNKVTEKSTKSVDKPTTNEYNAGEISSSLTSPGNIRAESQDSVSRTPIATTFSFNQRDITTNGKHQKSAVTDKVQEENQTSEHFSYETYGEFMKKYEAAEKEINDRLDKQMDKERAEKMERFNELTKKEDKTDAEGNEMMKLAGELNNMSNKYDRLKEQGFNKEHPELVAEKQRQNEIFDRDWKAVMDKKMEEINKPFNNLRDKYLKELRDELGIADDVTLDSDFYNSLTPEQKKIADEINKEYAEKYEELRQKTASIKKIEEESKTKITKNKKNKVTNPSKAKTTSLFNENEVDKGNKSEGLNPDALPLSDYREMQRLNDGYSLTSLSSALSKESLKDYMANKIANEKIGVKPDFDDNEAWDKLPEDFEDDWGAVATDIEEMYDAYEEYLDMKNGGDTFDENTLKNTLESANDYANRQFPGKTAKEVIDQYTPEYESDLKVYNRLIKKYPSVFSNGKIDLTGAEGKARREFANQDNETAQDIDYQELAERENETPQVEDEELNTSPLDLEFESERRTAEELDENETPQANEEEMNKVTKRQPEKPKNLVTSKKEDNFMEEQAKSFDTPEAFIESAVSKDYKVGDNVKGLGTIQDVTDTQVKINGQRFAKKILGDNIDNVTLSTIRSTLDNLQAKNKDISDIISARKKGLYLLSFIQNSKNKQHLADIGYLEPVGDSSGAEGFTTAKSHMRDYANLKHGVENAEKQLREYWESVNKGNSEDSGTSEQQSEFETLPDDVTVSQEAKQLGAKRIAPDRVPRQQLTFEEGVNKIAENLETLAEYKKARDEIYSPEGYNDGEVYIRYNNLKKEFQNIMYGNNGFQFKSNKSKEFTDLWKNIVDNKDNKTALREVAKNFYISKVKKDISKGYVYPQEVLDKIPGAKKAINNRERYEKGLNTSFSAKDERIDYSEKDKIGAGMKSQDGKQITKEQKEDIVKGILDFGKTLGLDMKKFAEDRGLVYVHLHGGLAFLNNMAAGLYRESTNEQGEKNISVSVGGAENVRYKDPKTKERKTSTLNTTMSHELGHAMDYLLDNKLFSWTQKSILGSKYNPVNRLRKYYAKGNEIVARAIEQYVAVENGQPNYYEENGNLDAGELKGTDLEYYLKELGSYYERPGYWSKPDYEKYVKPYVEEAFKNNFNEYKITPEQKDTKANSKNTVTASDLNKVTNR